MKHTVRMVAWGVLVAAVAVVLAVPVVASVAVTVRGGQAEVGSVVAWSSRTVSVLSGKADRLLFLVRCPMIQNGL